MTLQDMVDQHGPFFETATLAGTVHQLNKTVTSDGKIWISFAWFVVDEPGPRGLVEIHLLPDDYETLGGLFHENASLLISGRWNRTEHPAVLDVDRASPRN